MSERDPDRFSIEWMSSFWFLPRKGELRIESHEIVLQRGKKRVASAIGPGAGAIGKWAQSYVGVSGSVIHLEGLRIGAYGLLVDETDYTRDPSESVDAWLDASTAHALIARLRMLGVIQTKALADAGYRGRLAAPAWSIELMPATVSIWAPMAIWIGAMVAAGLVGSVVAVIDQSAGMVVTCVIIFAGLWLSIRSGRRKRPSRQLRFESGLVALEDTPTHARLATCRRSELCAAPGHAVVSAHIRMELMTIELTIGAAKPFRIGASDPGFRWNTETPESKSAQYFVGPPEWRRLLDELGLTERMAYGRIQP